MTRRAPRAPRAAALALLGGLVLAALVVTFLLAAPLGGDGGGIEPGARGDEEVIAAARRCREPADASGRASCVDAWAAAHSGQCVAFAAELARGAEPSPDLALQALRVAPDSEEKQALLWEISRVALDRGMLAEAEQALTFPPGPPGPPVSSGASTGTANPVTSPPDAGLPPTSGPPPDADELREAAEPMLAELRAKQRRWADAFEIYARMADRDLTAEEPVERAVKVLAIHVDPPYKSLTQEPIPRPLEALVRDGRVEVVSYCRLLREGSPGGSGKRAERRPLQVLACVRAGLRAKALSQEDAEPLALDALAEIPALRLEELQRLAPPGLRVLETAAACHAKGSPAAPAAKGRAWRGREAAVYVRMAEGHQDDAVRLCYLRFARDNCLEGIKAGKRCSNLWSFGMYLQLLAKVDKERLGGELGALIENDKGLRESPEGEVRRIIADKGEMYRAITRPSAARTEEQQQQILTALFDIHLVLAQVLTTQPGLAGGTGVLSPAYHVKHAQHLWQKLWPAKEFPEEMLPEAARAFLERRPPRPGARRIEPQ